MIRHAAALPLLSALILSTPALAQDALRSAPQAVPVSIAVPDAQDAPYAPGAMQLDIDATDLARARWKVTQTVPVAPGTRDLVLMLPQWIPGHHSPSGTIQQLVDMHFFADGKELAWRRDPVEIFAFHVSVPEGAREVVAKFTHSSPVQGDQGRITMTPEMLNLQWDRMSLYPAGHYVRRIRVRPTVTFPEGWRVFTALNGQSAQSGKVSWAETDYETLIDSPVFAGKHARKWDIGHGVSLDVVADKPEQLALKDEHLATFRALTDEAMLAFGAKHFDHYDFLLGMTDRMGGIGLEHHRSSENTYDPETFTKWEEKDWSRNVIPHEFSHSWDGKFRRPAKLWTPDYRQPMQDNLLWVYEGQTQYWGLVLAARSGVQSKEAILGTLANYVGNFLYQPGRGWRSVDDTAHEPILGRSGGKAFYSMGRAQDYYTEGALVWIEADQIIRDGTKGAKSLDDFARAFFGIKDGDWGEVTYEFADVVAALNGVYAYDWAGFLDQRINKPGQPVPVGGIERGGYKLVWKEEPNPYDKPRYAESKGLSLAFSLGFVIGKDGTVGNTIWDSPGFNAGIVPGVKIVAVNGIAYDQDVMRSAIKAAKDSKEPIQLLTQRGERFTTIAIDWHGGMRYPWLERAAPGSAPTGLDRLLAPRRVLPPPAKKPKKKA